MPMTPQVNNKPHNITNFTWYSPNDTTDLLLPTKKEIHNKVCKIWHIQIEYIHINTDKCADIHNGEGKCGYIKKSTFACVITNN